jgi:hypothetical protein
MSTRSQAPFSPFIPGSANIFTRNNESSPRAASQLLAKAATNQFNYSNVNWSYNGAAAPSFYGYSGYGFNGLKPGFATTAAAADQGLFVVPAGQATVKVTLVNNKHEIEGSPRAGLAKLQTYFEAVPVPTLELVLPGILAGEGTDEPCCIYQPSTGKMWDIWRLKFVEGIGWTFQYGAYIGPGSEAGFNGKVSEWNGIYQPAFGGEVFGTRASGLVDIAGLITMQDLVEVMRGKPDFGHVLGLIIGTTKPEGGKDIHVAPATKNDSGTAANSHPFLPNNINAGTFSYTEEKPNGAYTEGSPKGFIDGVPEGTHLILPKGIKVEEFAAITGTIAKAFFRTLAKYGMVTIDRTTSGCIIPIEIPAALGSPYTGQEANAKVNPIAGYTGAGDWTSYTWGHGYTKVSQFVPASWTDPTLPTITEEPVGTASWVMSVLGSEAMRQLEVLEPYAS